MFKKMIIIVLFSGFMIGSGQINALKCGLPEDQCNVFLPNPVIALDSYQWINGRVYINLTVVNRSVYPDNLFRQAPELPSCAPNDPKHPPAARTWVYIYDADTHKQLMGFCNLPSLDQGVWFSPSDRKRFGRVYVVLWDRACGCGYSLRFYTSNVISWSILA
jgi:hypothetical protein